MKRYLLLLLTAVTAITACKKDKNQDGNLVGTWELRHLKGTQIEGRSDLPSGNGEIIQFTQTNMKTFSKKKLVSDFRYSVVKKDDTVNNVKVSYQLIWDSDPASVNPHFKVSGNTLTFYYETNGVDQLYQKLK